MPTDHAALLNAHTYQLAEDYLPHFWQTAPNANALMMALVRPVHVQQKDLRAQIRELVLEMRVDSRKMVLEAELNRRFDPIDNGISTTRGTGDLAFTLNLPLKFQLQPQNLQRIDAFLTTVLPVGSTYTKNYV